MKIQLPDTRLSTILETLRVIYPQVYLRTKRHIEMTCEKARMEDMEKSFLGLRDGAYNVYQVAPAMREDIAWYLGTPCGDSQNSFLIVSSDRNCAALYHLNAERYITDRCYLFSHSGVTDVLETFEGSLFLALRDLPNEGSFAAPSAYLPARAFQNAREEESDENGSL